MTEKMLLSLSDLVVSLTIPSNFPSEPHPQPHSPSEPPPQLTFPEQTSLPHEQIYAILAGMVDIEAAILEVIRENGCFPEVLYQYFTTILEYKFVLPGMPPFKGTLNGFIAQNSLCYKRMREELDKSRIFKIVRTPDNNELVLPRDTPVPDTGYVPHYKVDPWVFAHLLAGEKIEQRYIRWTFNGSDKGKGQWWQRKDHDKIARDPRFRWHVQCQNNYWYVPFRLPSIDAKYIVRAPNTKGVGVLPRPYPLSS
jgi:hypothetical protein